VNQQHQVERRLRQQSREEVASIVDYMGRMYRSNLTVYAVWSVIIMKLPDMVPANLPLLFVQSFFIAKLHLCDRLAALLAPLTEAAH
jgi:hypothetical protein